MKNLKNIDYIAKILYDAYNVPVMFIDFKMNVTVELNHGIKNPVFEKDYNAHLIQDVDDVNFPLLKVTNYLENFIFIHVEENNIRAGTLVIGPSLSTEITDKIVSGLIYDHQIQLHYKDVLLRYYENLVFVSQIELLHIAQAAHFLIFDQPIDETSLVNKWRLQANNDTNLEKQVQMRRLETSFHMDKRYEDSIWLYIKKGDKHGLTQYLNELKVEGAGMLSKKSHLRHTKNQAIISVGLATRASIEGGLYPEISFTMSDIYIQLIEDAKEVNRINLYINEFFFKLIDHIQSNNLIKQSRPVSVCKNYIFNHIFEKISINELADIVNLNPMYLSQLFKKETGIPLGQYIQQEKLNEAKKMLIQSNSSVAEISMFLQFSDQSYFTSSFKKYTGLTPSQFRNNPTLESKSNHKTL